MLHYWEEFEKHISKKFRHFVLQAFKAHDSFKKASVFLIVFDFVITDLNKLHPNKKF